MRALLRQLRPAVAALAVLTVLCGAAYPLLVYGIGQAVFPGQANGSIVYRDGVAVGSRLLGQSFVAPGYFHPRPSAAGDGYDAMASAGSNLGPTNPDLIDAISERVADYRTENGLASNVAVPIDAVTASGSGLDPHITIANARLQAPRVATARGLPVDTVLALVDGATTARPLSILGDSGVNVLELNMALDRS